MFHEMSEENRANLADLLRECQDHILRREGVQRTAMPLPGSVGSMVLEKDLPPGSAHAFGKLEEAVFYLGSPRPTGTALIKDTYGDGYTFIHNHGCYRCQYFTGDKWHVSKYGTGQLWTITPQDGTRQSFWLSDHGDRGRIPVNGDWLSALNMIEATFGFNED